MTIIDVPFASALDTTILDVFQSLQSAITQFLHICTVVDHFFIKESTVFLKVSHGLSETVYSPGDKYKYLFTVSLELHDDVELLFSVKSEHTAKANGTFVYHGEKFRVNLPFKKFTLCVSPTIGVKAFYNGRYYDVELAEPLQDTISDSMPIVEKELIRRYFYRDGHSNLAEVR